MRQRSQLLSTLVGLLCLGTLASDSWAGESDRHWAFRPLQLQPPPEFIERVDREWVRNPIDAFVLQKLRQSGLQPATPVERATLLRRVTFDLTGLPPTPEEVQAFVNDSTQTYEGLIDRLLASPQYGERWGRHWLDVVRYAETEGFEYDRLQAGIWRYRDYVVDSFNRDTPLDRFILEQVAGHELAPRPEHQVAAGFHRLGPVRRNAGNIDVAMSRNEVLTEMTDAIGTAFLGVTVGCARCHDHMFDDVPQKDYYRLQAFLSATHEHDVVLSDDATRKAWEARTEKLQAQIKELQKQLTDNPRHPDRDQIESQVVELKRSLPDPLPTINTVHSDLAARTPIHVLQRGNPETPLSAVGPRPLGALVPATVAELPSDAERPCSELARWLASPDHPLVTRVWVNRIWQQHFGRGIVATPNDFGLAGAGVSHPELLDWLSSEFLRLGRRTKPLHRLILLSNTYRQSIAAHDTEQMQRLDPHNRLLSHFSRRRLSAEEVRDAMLAASGRLNARLGGPSVMAPVEEDLVRLLYDPQQWRVTADPREHDRRSLYLLAKRNLQLPFFQVFDQPDAQVSCSRREQSTHALQALELLNGQQANGCAAALAQRLMRECGAEGPARVERAFQLTVGRAPTSAERASVQEFLQEHTAGEFALALLNSNAFIYVD